MDNLRGMPDVGKGNLLVVQRDIALDVPGKNKHILLYLTDGAAQHVGVDFFDVDAVDQDLTFLDVEVTSDQV